MPGKLLDAVTKEIIVPDKELKTWYHHSNPIKYAEWFEDQARTQIINYIRKNRLVMNSVEPIEEQEIASHLEPLRRAVQLIKRYRDIFCDENDTVAVRSIIICTLMGNITSAYSDTLEIIKIFVNMLMLK